mgnify:CR=1 FL=1
MLNHDPEWDKGVEAARSGDLTGALFVFKKIANQKNGEAAFVEIGNIYEFGGHNFERDLDEAKKWYEKSVTLVGDTKAYLGLGRLYASEISTFKNYATAVDYFYAVKKERGAKFALGYMHEKGLGVEQDYELAITYYKLAADQGHVMALRNYGLLNIKTKRYRIGLTNFLKGAYQITQISYKDKNDERLRIS